MSVKSTVLAFAKCRWRKCSVTGDGGFTLDS